MKRENWVDIAKGIGIVLVVYGHVARGLFNAEIPLNYDFYKSIDKLIYAFHMPLFFFISGYLYSSSILKKSTLYVLKDKIRSILYLYIFWSVLHGIVEVLMSDFTNGSVRMPDVMTVWRPRAHFWFLYSLFLVFVIATLIYWVRKDYIKYIVFLLAIGLYYYPEMLQLGYISYWISPWLVYFTGGVAIARYMTSFDMRIWILSVVCLAILAVGSGLPLIDASFGIAIILWISRCLDAYTDGFIKSAIIYLGRLSLPIYIIHVLSGSGIRIILQKVFNVESFWIHLIAGMIFGIILPIVLHRFSIRYRCNFLWEFPRFRLNYKHK